MQTIEANCLPPRDRHDQVHDLGSGSNVLETVTGSGRLITDAKCRVGSTGIGVSIDACSRFLSIDLPLTLRSRRLDPNDVLSKCMNLLDSDFVDRVREIAGALRTYDYTLVIRRLITVPADERDDIFPKLRALLTPKGLIIVNMSAHFKADLSATNDSTPMQFLAPVSQPRLYRGA
ncbi:hypothetical protein N0V91_011313 [Didymella pomorum]|uniref:Uncharacterized protein n=1 Tax=Didymella pomorum TaxID=749634 RepID=A0A9W8YVT9_9PLEO|nr:hypothetical protein N0V91_011313 [Didymella pomorum]